MTKYATPQETTKIIAVWASVPAQLAKENHNFSTRLLFQYKVIKSGACAYEYAPPLVCRSADHVWVKNLKTFISLYIPLCNLSVY